MGLDPITAALVMTKGTGLPPNDMQAMSAVSTESGIKVTFTGPANSYLTGEAAGDTLACVPAGVMLRYSPDAYPTSIGEGELVGYFREDYNPVAPVSVETEVVGLTFGQTYYFTAFPFSTEGTYNLSQAAANRATCAWMGTKGTINVNVQAYEGFEGVIGDYTITLIDQAEGGQNIEQAASGTGIKQIGNLEAGKSYIVALSDTSNLMADPSEVVTIEAGLTYNVDMTYRQKYGVLNVNVTTASDFATLGDYTITLIDQVGSANVEKQANGKGVTTFDSLVDGSVYKVRLGSTENFLPPADSDSITIVGGQTDEITMTYQPGLGSVNVVVSTTPTGMPIGGYTVSLVPTSGGSTLSQTGSGSQTVSFASVPVGSYTVSLSAISHYTADGGGTLTVSGGQTSSHSVYYQYSASLSSASWSEINTISTAGKASSCWSVGDTKSITVSGETITTEIVGFNHDDLQSGGKAGITFGMKNLMASTRTMNSADTNSGSFVGSAMYTDYLSTSFLTGLPSDLQAVIKTVNKKTGTGGGSSSGTRTDAVKIFLFAEVEVFGSTTHSVSGEGSQYSRFTNSSSRIKYLSNGSGSAYWWWLRSPFSGYSGGFCAVRSDGAVYDGYASSTGGVCAGFCV